MSGLGLFVLWMSLSMGGFFASLFTGTSVDTQLDRLYFQGVALLSVYLVQKLSK